MPERETIVQKRRELAAEGVAVCARIHQDVSGYRREAAADGPDVEIVHLLYARHAEHRVGNLARLFRRDVQQDPRRLTQERVARPEDQSGDDEARDGVRLVPAGRQDDGARHRGAGERGNVGGDVQEGAAYVQALATRAREHRSCQQKFLQSRRLPA